MEERLTESERKILDLVNQFPGKTTHGLRVAMGYSTGMDNTVRLRLTILEKRGLLRCVEDEQNKAGPARRWYPVKGE